MDDKEMIELYGIELRLLEFGNIRFDFMRKDKKTWYYVISSYHKNASLYVGPRSKTRLEAARACLKTMADILFESAERIEENR